MVVKLQQTSLNILYIVSTRGQTQRFTYIEARYMLAKLSKA